MARTHQSQESRLASAPQKDDANLIKTHGNMRSPSKGKRSTTAAAKLEGSSNAEEKNQIHRTSPRANAASKTSASARPKSAAVKPKKSAPDRPGPKKKTQLEAKGRLKPVTKEKAKSSPSKDAVATAREAIHSAREAITSARLALSSARESIHAQKEKEKEKEKVRDNGTEEGARVSRGSLLKDFSTSIKRWFTSNPAHG